MSAIPTSPYPKTLAATPSPVPPPSDGLTPSPDGMQQQNKECKSLLSINQFIQLFCNLLFPLVMWTDFNDVVRAPMTISFNDIVRALVVAVILVEEQDLRKVAVAFSVSLIVFQMFNNKRQTDE